MSAVRIVAALAAKGLAAEPQYMRGHSGGGWLIGLTDDAEQCLIDRGFDGDFDPDFSNTDAVLSWVDDLPAPKGD